MVPLMAPYVNCSNQPLKPPTPHTHAADQAAGRRFGMEPIRKSVREWGQCRVGAGGAKRYQILRSISASAGKGAKQRDGP